MRDADQVGGANMRQADSGEAVVKHRVVAFATLFGGFHFRNADGGEIAISNKRARAALAILCLEAGEAIDRDHLSKLLWPGRFEAHAKASLRQSLLELGKALEAAGNDLLRVTRNSVSINPAVVDTDFLRLERALQSGEYKEAAGLLAAIGTSPLLDQMTFGDAFGDWLSRHRAKAELRLQVAVDEGLAMLKQAGDVDGHARLLTSWSVRNHAAALPTTAARDTRTKVAVLPFQCSFFIEEFYDIQSV